MPGQELPASPPRRLALLLLLALAHGPVAVEGRASACNGDFQCSSTTSEDPDLVLEFGNASVACKYGHTEIDGDCRRGCRGTRFAPCRCQTQEEAEDGIRTDARTSLLASLLMVVLGCCCTCGCYRKLFKVKALDDSGSEDQGESVEVEDGPGTGAVDNDPEVAEPAPPQTQDATVEGAAGAGNEAGRPQRRSLVEVASTTADKLAQEHPCKFRIVRIVVPLAILALLSWGSYELAIMEGHIYDTYGSFIGAVAIFTFALSLASLVVVRLAKKRCCSKDDPLACVSQAASMVIMLIPALGTVGLVWSVHRMLYPGGFYHAC